jgi:Mor family transcriptional regulator
VNSEWLKEIAAEMTVDCLPECYQAIAEIIGVEATLNLSEYLGGTRFYFRKIDGLLMDKRDERIRKEFTGFNHLELARRYGLTETRIRDILRGKSQQCKLFDSEQ